LRISFEQLERLLLQVQRPGRYVGGEVNAVHKDWDTIPTRVCLAFPDVYELGMSNLGLAVLYDILNGHQDLLAERTYAPWPDMAMAMREAGIPLFSIESRRPLTSFDIVGFSLPYEILYTNLLEMLHLAGLPLASAERDERHPLVVAGGHATFNPEPVAGFVDAFIIGEGEEAIVDLVRAFEQARSESREVQLAAVAQVPGVYVPRFYSVDYHPDGTVSAVAPSRPEAAPQVLRRIVPVLPPPPTRQLVPNISVAHDRGVIEIQRGCGRGCRFCHAGIVTRPVRERPCEEVLAAVECILQETGYGEIALLSLSSSDYSHIDQVVEMLAERYADQHISLSLPSLRIESFSIDLAESISRGRRTGFTFAPEAGTERLREVINKPIPGGEMLEIARQVFQRGWRTIKLYFMIGLPGEEPEDIDALVDLVHAVRAEGRKAHGRQAQVNVSINTFVPKPHTPFQWAPLAAQDQIQVMQQRLQQRLRGRGLKVSWSDWRTTLIEATLSRGDRRLGPVIQEAWEQGARFDGWNEWFDYGAWAAAFAVVGARASGAPIAAPEPAFYAHRERGKEEIFPWDHISTGVRKGYLWREWQLSQEGRSRPGCREKCLGCGILTAFGDVWAPVWECPPVQPAQEGGEEG